MGGQCPKERTGLRKTHVIAIAILVDDVARPFRCVDLRISAYGRSE